MILEDEDEDDWMVSRCGKPELHLTAAEDKVEEEEAIKVEEEVDAG